MQSHQKENVCVLCCRLISVFLFLLLAAFLRLRCRNGSGGNENKRKDANIGFNFSFLACSAHSRIFLVVKSNRGESLVLFCFLKLEGFGMFLYVSMHDFAVWCHLWQAGRWKLIFFKLQSSFNWWASFKTALTDEQALSSNFNWGASFEAVKNTFRALNLHFSAWIRWLHLRTSMNASSFHRWMFFIPNNRHSKFCCPRRVVRECFHSHCGSLTAVEVCLFQQQKSSRASFEASARHSNVELPLPIIRDDLDCSDCEGLRVIVDKHASRALFVQLLKGVKLTSSKGSLVLAAAGDDWTLHYEKGTYQRVMFYANYRI